jgi:hypothetical protein
MDFLDLVQDQTVNLTPMGGDGGAYHLAPRLEGWVAACDLYRIPIERRAYLVDQARFLFDATHGRVTVHQLYMIDQSEFEAPSLESLNG